MIDLVGSGHLATIRLKQLSHRLLDHQLPSSYVCLLSTEHKKTTVINLVGLQVWRGALLLADFIITNRKELANKKLLEVGSGVGLTSIIAAKYCKEVICTGAHSIIVFFVVL